MFAIPIASRQARETCRRPRAYHARWIVGLIGLLAIPVGLYIGQYNQQKGIALFGTLACIAQLYCLLAGVIVASDAISSERREDTLGLLFLTDLKPRHVLAGKFLASSTIAIFGLLAFIPFLALPQMMGGVTAEHFVLLTVQLLNTLFLSIAWGLLVSTIFKRGWAALCAGISVMLALGLGYGIWRIWFNGDFWEAIDFMCPTMGLISVISDRIDDRERYWESIAFNHLCAWGLLAIVAVRLMYIWRDPTLTNKQQRRRERFRLLRFGNREARQRLRKKLLDASPLAWLANRDYVSSSGLLALFFFSFGGMLLLWLFAPDWRTDEVAFISALTLILAHLILYFRICIAAAYQLSEDRKSGALELLLSTPLSVSEILRGRWLGLARQFFGPALILIVTHLIALAATIWNFEQPSVMKLWRELSTLKWGDDQLMLFFHALSFLIPPLNWIAAGWLGMWMGLRFKSSAASVWVTVVLVLLTPWILLLGGLLASFILLKPFQIEDDRIWTIFAISAFVLGFGNAAILMHFGRARLRNYFRPAASDRFHVYKIPFPWRFVLRLAGTVVALVAVGIFSAWLWCQRANQRGEELWAAARKAYPQFAEASSELPALDPIPREKNLAFAPLLAPLNETNRIVRRRNQGIQNLPNPFSQQFAAPTNRWMQSPGHMNNWKRGELVNLDKYVEYAQARRVLTNLSGPAPQFILDGLKGAEPIVRELQKEAAARPLTQFRQNHSAVGELASMLSLRALARLRLGEAPADDVRLIFRLAQGVHYYNPTRHGALMSTFQPIFEGILQQRWNEAQLAEFENTFAAFDLWPLYQINVNKLTGQALKDLTASLESRKKEDIFLEHGLSRFYPLGLVWEAKAKVVQTAGRDLPTIVDVRSRTLNALRANSLLAHPESRIEFQDRIYGYLIEFAQLQTRLNEIQIACAIERFRLRKGRLPARLDELTPLFLDTLPNDLFRHQPLIYRRTDDTQNYLLYSIGWDNTDHFPTLRSFDNPEVDEPGWPWRSRGEPDPKRPSMTNAPR